MMAGNALNSSVKVPPVNVVPQAPRAQSSRQPDLDSDGMLAVNVDSTNEAYYVGCSGLADVPYRHFGACGNTRVCERARVRACVRTLAGEERSWRRLNALS